MYCAQGSEGEGVVRKWRPKEGSSHRPKVYTVGVSSMCGGWRRMRLAAGRCFVDGVLDWIHPCKREVWTGSRSSGKWSSSVWVRVLSGVYSSHV
jgi:hypothetical protein